MNDTTGKDEQDFKEPFDEWLRAMKPPVPDSSQEKEAFLDEFRKKLTAQKLARKNRLRRNAKRGLVVMSLSVLCVFAFNLTDLGSDGFDMVEVEDAETQGGVVKNVFRGDGFNLLPGETQQEIRETNQQITLDEGNIVEVEGWLLNGDVFWLIKRKHIIKGTEKVISRATKVPQSISSPKLATFLSSDDWDNLFQRIQGGEIPSDGEKKLELDGVWFSVQSWPFSTSNSDEGAYYWGRPIR